MLMPRIEMGRPHCTGHPSAGMLRKRYAESMLYTCIRACIVMDMKRTNGSGGLLEEGGAAAVISC